MLESGSVIGLVFTVLMRSLPDVYQNVSIFIVGPLVADAPEFSLLICLLVTEGVNCLFSITWDSYANGGRFADYTGMDARNGFTACTVDEQLLGSDARANTCACLEQSHAAGRC